VNTRIVTAAALTALAACARAPVAPPPAPAAGAPPRQALNRAALELGLPLFWTSDRNGNGRVDAEELAIVWGLDPRPPSHWIADGRLTAAFDEAWARATARAANPSPPPDARRAALAREVSQSYFTVLESDFSGAPPEDRAVVSHVLAAAAIVERLYARQLGTLGMEARIPEDDGLSRLVFFLEQRPWCSAPATEKDPVCSAIAPAPPRLTGLYPADMQARQGFCEELARDPRAEALTDPFTVVVRDGRGALAAIPFHEAWREDMQAVARELDAAAAAVASPGEAAFRAYLTAAAQAFRDGSWFQADEAWSRMNAENSRWYLRIGPDEVYYEPCNLKAGFHVGLARIDPASLAWQRRLEPVKGEMERELARLAGPPYVARDVSFHLPDFIDVVLNAGDARDARGATIGQSLPNWGPVANEGRGRTVAMVNLYEDPESRAMVRGVAASLLCPASMERFAEDPDATVMGTVLHEAAHNLGPSHEYAVDGRTDGAIFGGPLASTLEELKAQTTALWLTDWLAGKGVVSRELAEKAHVRDVVWTFGHVSRGMYDAEGKIKPYSALAAIQVGFLLEKGALSWSPDAPAANGTDRGCLEIDFARMPAAVTDLETGVLGIKARGDAEAARALETRYVRAEGPLAALFGTITERVLRHPAATFLYSVRP
jgi:hypothetical protein